MKFCGFWRKKKGKVEPASSIEESVFYSDLGESMSIVTDSEVFDDDTVDINRAEEADERMLSMLPASLSLSSKNSLDSIKNFEASFKEYLSPNRTMTSEYKGEDAGPNLDASDAEGEETSTEPDVTCMKKHVSGANLINYELVIKPRYNTDKQESAFKCILRRVGADSDSQDFCELAVDEVVNHNIHTLIDSLGLSDDAMKIGKSQLTGKTCERQSKGDCTNLISLLSCKKSQKKTSLRQYLEESGDFPSVNRDLSALSTISDITVDDDEFTIFDHIAMIVDRAINRIVDDSLQNSSYPTEVSNRARPRNRFGDMSDIPLLF